MHPLPIGTTAFLNRVAKKGSKLRPVSRQIPVLSHPFHGSINRVSIKVEGGVELSNGPLIIVLTVLHNLDESKLHAHIESFTKVLVFALHLGNVDVLLGGNNILLLGSINLRIDLYLTHGVEERILSQVVTRNTVGINLAKLLICKLGPRGDLLLARTRSRGGLLLTG